MADILSSSGVSEATKKLNQAIDNFRKKNTYKDNLIAKCLRFIKSDFDYYDIDHTGFFEHDINTMKSFYSFNNFDERRYAARIYLNIPDRVNAHLFILEYMRKCRMQNITINMKAFHNCNYADIRRNDSTILYMKEEEISKQIEILEEIRKEHPEWIKDFGTPPLGCGRLRDGTYTSYYGFSHGGPYDYYYGLTKIGGNYDAGTYNDYFDQIYEYAFYRHICEMMMNNKTRTAPAIATI